MKELFNRHLKFNERDSGVLLKGKKIDENRFEVVENDFENGEKYIYRMDSERKMWKKICKIMVECINCLE